ncbi:MAG: hypothetical protein ACRCX2_38955 [Paraclostridium sp.]
MSNYIDKLKKIMKTSHMTKFNNKNIPEAIYYNLDKLYKLDKKNYEMYKEFFENASENEILETLNTPLTIYTEPRKEPDTNVVRKLLKSENIIVEEHFTLPFQYINSEGKPTISRVKLLMLPIQARRLQQMSFKENKVALSKSTRNLTGQATGESRSGSLSDTEQLSLVAQGFSTVQKELNNSRSCNPVDAKAVRTQIEQSGKVELSKLTNDYKDNQTLKYIHNKLVGAWLISSLVEDPDHVS